MILRKQVKSYLFILFKLQHFSQLDHYQIYGFSEVKHVGQQL